MKPEGTFIILTPGFAATENDSTCLPMQQSLIRTLNEIFPHLKIVVLSFQYPYRVDNYQWYGARVHSFNGRNKGGIARLLLRKKIGARLQQLHRSETIVGLFSFWYGECAAVGKKFGAAHNIKHFSWLLGQDARKGNKYPGRVPPNANELIALSDFIQFEFEKNFGIKPAYVIPPAINSKHQPLGTLRKEFDILAVGSLIPLKQYSLLIPVISQIKKHIPTVKAVVIGKGPEKKKLEDLAAKAGLEDNLQFIGELPHGEVGKMMQKATVFLHPSSYEGFGVVCLEALYAGMQVISFVQPMRRHIENWNRVENAEDMAKKTIDLLRTPHSSSPQLVYSMENTARNLMKLYFPEKKKDSLADFL
jgi:glycosyltransferase involved in cell wall biosynthesis